MSFIRIRFFFVNCLKKNKKIGKNEHFSCLMEVPSRLLLASKGVIVSFMQKRALQVNLLT